jgi:hypothetical protein
MTYVIFYFDLCYIYVQLISSMRKISIFSELIQNKIFKSFEKQLFNSVTKQNQHQATNRFVSRNQAVMGNISIFTYLCKP